jgi:hypothetical protein
LFTKVGEALSDPSLLMPFLLLPSSLCLGVIDIAILRSLLFEYLELVVDCS